MKNELSSSVNLALNKAARAASALKTPYITPELFLQGLLALDRFRSVVSGLVPHMSVVEKALSDYIDEHAEKEEKAPDGLELSFQLMQVFEFADEQVTNAHADRLDVPHVVHAFYRLEDRMNLRCAPFLKRGTEKKWRSLYASRLMIFRLSLPVRLPMSVSSMPTT